MEEDRWRGDEAGLTRIIGAEVGIGWIRVSERRRGGNTDWGRWKSVGGG